MNLTTYRPEEAFIPLTLQFIVGTMTKINLCSLRVSPMGKVKDHGITYLS
jgi:hypothetical protein